MDAATSTFWHAAASTPPLRGACSRPRPWQHLLLCQTTPADILALEPNVAHLLMQCLVEAKLSQMVRTSKEPVARENFLKAQKRDASNEEKSQELSKEFSWSLEEKQKGISKETGLTGCYKYWMLRKSCGLADAGFLPLHLLLVLSSCCKYRHVCCQFLEAKSAAPILLYAPLHNSDIWTHRCSFDRFFPFFFSSLVRNTRLVHCLFDWKYMLQVHFRASCPS